MTRFTGAGIRTAGTGLRDLAAGIPVATCAAKEASRSPQPFAIAMIAVAVFLVSAGVWAWLTGTSQPTKVAQSQERDNSQKVKSNHTAGAPVPLYLRQSKGRFSRLAPKRQPALNCRRTKRQCQHPSNRTHPNRSRQSPNHPNPEPAKPEPPTPSQPSALSIGRTWEAAHSASGSPTPSTEVIEEKRTRFRRPRRRRRR